MRRLVESDQWNSGRPCFCASWNKLTVRLTSCEHHMRLAAQVKHYCIIYLISDYCYLKIAKTEYVKRRQPIVYLHNNNTKYGYATRMEEEDEMCAVIHI